MDSTLKNTCIEVFKRLFICLYLLATFFVTAATSKGTRGEVGFRTNYAVESDCENSIESIRIQVLGSSIMEALPEQNEEFTFFAFGFPIDYMRVGQNIIGEAEYRGYECKVVDEQVYPNDSYDPEERDFVFATPGYFTDTLYECFDREQYVCAISFQELPAGELSGEE